MSEGGREGGREVGREIRSRKADAFVAARAHATAVQSRRGPLVRFVCVRTCMRTCVRACVCVCVYLSAVVYVSFNKHLPHLILDRSEARTQDERTDLRHAALVACDHELVYEILSICPLLSTQTTQTNS